MCVDFMVGLLFVHDCSFPCMTMIEMNHAYISVEFSVFFIAKVHY